LTFKIIGGSPKDCEPEKKKNSKMGSKRVKN